MTIEGWNLHLQSILPIFILIRSRTSIESILPIITICVALISLKSNECRASLSSPVASELSQTVIRIPRVKVRWWGVRWVSPRSLVSMTIEHSRSISSLLFRIALHMTKFLSWDWNLMKTPPINVSISDPTGEYKTLSKTCVTSSHWLPWQQTQYPWCPVLQLPLDAPTSLPWASMSYFANEPVEYLSRTLTLVTTPIGRTMSLI